MTKGIDGGMLSLCSGFSEGKIVCITIVICIVSMLSCSSKHVQLIKLARFTNISLNIISSTSPKFFVNYKILNQENHHITTIMLPTEV